MEAMEEAGLLGECKKRWPVQVRTDPITDNYAVEARPFARGKFASVRRCRHLVSGQEFAAKYMRKRRRAQDVRHEIMHEARVLKLSSQHPRVVRMHEVYETPSEIVLVLELVPGGELQRVLDDEEAVEEAAAARLLRQILDGVAFLHQHRIAHLDIKPQNLLLTAPFPNGEVKLCDFGISRLITKGIEIREIVGTPDYVAPEVLHYEPISLPTDMWSLGVLTYVLLSGHSPFGGETKQETFCNITRGTLDFPQDLFSGVSAQATHFIRGLLQRDTRERMTAEECLSHPWLNPCGSPLPGIHLTLSPEGASEPQDNPSPSSVRRRSLERNVSTESPSAKTTRTEDPSGDPSEPSPNVHHTSPLIQQNGTSDCKSPPNHQNETSTFDFQHNSPSMQRNSTCKTEEDKRLFCKSPSVVQTEPSHEPSTNVHHNGTSDCSDGDFSKSTRTEEDKKPFCNSAFGNKIDSSQEPKGGVSEVVHHMSPTLQHNGTSDSKLVMTEEDIQKDGKFFCKRASGNQNEPCPVLAQDKSPSPGVVRHKSPLLHHIGINVGAFCKSISGDSRDPSHEASPDVTRIVHHKSPLLQHNGTRISNRVGFFCKNASGDDKDTLQENVHHKSPSPQRIGTSDSSSGAFCKISDSVAQTTFSSQSRHSEVKTTTFTSKNNSSAVVDQGSGVLCKSTETTESKSRSVDMVVSQFEGMSKRIVFSEEIIVDERVGMVY